MILVLSRCMSLVCQVSRLDSPLLNHYDYLTCHCPIKISIKAPIYNQFLSLQTNFSSDVPVKLKLLVKN